MVVSQAMLDYDAEPSSEPVQSQPGVAVPRDGTYPAPYEPDPRVPWRWAKHDIRYERRLSAMLRPVVARPREGRTTRRSAASRAVRRAGSKSPPGESEPPPSLRRLEGGGV
jgi:hypothetical protein